MSIKQRISTLLLKECIDYIDKNPQENLPKILNWFEKVIVDKDDKEILQELKKIVQEPDNNWNVYIQKVLSSLNPNVRTKILVNFFINVNVIGTSIVTKLKKKHDFNIPRAILFDPTAACNLKCIGCWANDYNKADSMDYELLDRIINEGKKLGIYAYIYSGGEPLLRKNDLISLAEMHSDCVFLSFTNGTLVDRQFCEELSRVGNLVLAISVEGYEEETDLRRGKGTYEKVMKSMDLLKEYGLAYGFSTCYHSKNTEVVGSNEYIDLMIEKGCIFGWYFTYIPVGKDADTTLIAAPEQREYMYHRMQELRQNKPIFLIDFWNDGAFTKGCIAGGRMYMHINARGDVEPCAFVHYSNVNIREMSLLEALQSPLFLEYRKNQPFNTNHLRPCPLLDNPEILREMVHHSCAHSTQLMDNEDVDELTGKCEAIASEWGDVADRLWAEKGE